MTSIGQEVETKFGVPEGFVLPDLIDVTRGIAAVERRPPLVLRATYFDTAGLRLARLGISLRHRTGEGRPQWTLKLPLPPGGGEALRRREISVPGPATTVPPELTVLLVGALRGDPLAPVAVLRTQRETVSLLDRTGATLGDVVDDHVSRLVGRRVVARFREIEVEQSAADGARAACRAVHRRLRASGAVAGQQLPKLVRALGPQAQAGSDVPAPPDVRPRSPAGDLVRWSLRTGLGRLVAADPGVRLAEPDAVHQMRVACRQLRSDLRTLGPLLADDRADVVRAELGWLAGSLAEARDLEVLLLRIVKTAAADPLAPLDEEGLAELRRLLHAQEDQAVAATREALSSPRYVSLLQLLVELATEPGLTDLAREPCREVLPGLIGTGWARLAKQAETLRPSDPDAAWHRARILAKRARYAAEVAAVALGRPAKRTASAAGAVQEVLGEHQDAATAAARFLTLGSAAAREPALAITCGRLAERERAQVHVARKRFDKTWREVRQHRGQSWMHP